MNIPPIRVCLVDDHPALRQGLALVLEHYGMVVCAEYESAREAMDSLPAAAMEMDLAVVDLSFEQDEGFGLISSLRERSIPVVVYSMHEDCSHISRSLACGAGGYVSKREDSKALLLGIAEVYQGRKYLSPRIAAAMADPPSVLSSLPRCSEREIQIISLLGQGLRASEIAGELELSVRTVESYCTRIYDKLELSGMKELRRFAMKNFRPEAGRLSE